MKKILQRHVHFWTNSSHRNNAFLGFFVFGISLIVNHFASIYALNHASDSVSDILLNILPVVNVDIIFIEGAIFFSMFIVALLLVEPKRTPIVLKTIALFIFVRSFFVILTHIGPYPTKALIDYTAAITMFTSGSDLFFSGHTGLPFLFALIFWEEYHLRLFFLFCSIVAALSVLFGHLHYSIDVFAAYFITYTIYHIAQKIFKKDFECFFE